MSITYVDRYEAVSVGPSKIAHSRPNANQKSQAAGWTLKSTPLWIFRQGPCIPSPLSFRYFKRPTWGQNWEGGSWGEKRAPTLAKRGQTLPRKHPVEPPPLPTTSPLCFSSCFSSPRPYPWASAWPNLAWASSNNNICLAAFQAHG